MKIRMLALGLAAATPALADSPHVWLDTDRGSIVLELDEVRAPLTTAHFLDIVDDGYYDRLVFHRTIPDFVIQAGRVTEFGQARPRNPNPTVQSERNNGLQHVIGSISIALPSTQSGPTHNGGTTEFFINTARNSNLDGDFTVFGQVVQGLDVIEDIGDGITYQTQMPFRPTLIERAVASDGFPVLPLHTGSWYDPANSGRGLSLEVATPPGGSGDPVLIVYWYDHFDGGQIWMNGAATFEYGASEITLPLQIAEGGQFGEAFDPGEVVFDPDFGSMTVSFSSCGAGTFNYQTPFGNGTMELVRLSIQSGNDCD
jgi:peptidyl-prolyl cis-trans isomerase A (cyclophilin A)